MPDCRLSSYDRSSWTVSSCYSFLSLIGTIDLVSGGGRPLPSALADRFQPKRSSRAPTNYCSYFVCRGLLKLVEAAA